jgi:hypothetical protein
VEEQDEKQPIEKEPGDWAQMRRRQNEVNLFFDRCCRRLRQIFGVCLVKRFRKQSGCQESFVFFDRCRGATSVDNKIEKEEKRTVDFEIVVENEIGVETGWQYEDGNKIVIVMVIEMRHVVDGDENQNSCDNCETSEMVPVKTTGPLLVDWSQKNGKQNCLPRDLQERKCHVFDHGIVAKCFANWKCCKQNQTLFVFPTLFVFLTLFVFFLFPLQFFFAFAKETEKFQGKVLVYVK